MTTHSQLKKTARLTGIWYLLMAISGLLGFMVFHPQLFVDDPQQTLTNLQEQESLARVRLVLEFIIIISQALSSMPAFTGAGCFLGHVKGQSCR